MIKVKNITKSFDKNPVLNNITFDIITGERLCIIGRSGCGKSVLLKIITGMIEADKGEVFFEDKAISQCTKLELFDIRKRIGYVFQSAALFDSYTVYENVVLALYDAGERNQKVLEDEACRVLSGVSLLPPIEEQATANYQNEWNTLKDSMPADLSGGMRKRVGVARALVGNPKYIFYDEPTTGLDPVTSEKIDNLILDLDKKFDVTSIIITHDIFSVYRLAEKVVMLSDGNVVFEGDVPALRESEDIVVKEFIERFNS